MARLLITVLPGLESIAIQELTGKLPSATVRAPRRGRVYADVDADATALRALRTADNVYLDLGECLAGPHRADLPALGAAAADLVPADLLERAAALGLFALPPVTLWVNASRAGKHTYSRFDAAATVVQAVLRRHPHWRLGTASEHSLELRLDIEDDRAWLSLRLTPPSFRFRGDERSFAAAAVRPPVAHALVWLTEPQPGDLFLDPFCGSGTIVYERISYPAARVVGSDTAAVALDAARANLTGTSAELYLWDARALPLDARSIDAMATNLPFGRQVLDEGALPALYLAFAREAQRVLAPGGVTIALTERPDVLAAAVERTRLRPEPVMTLSLKGLRPTVVRLRGAS